MTKHATERERLKTDSREAESDLGKVTAIVSKYEGLFKTKLGGARRNGKD